jgi:predicted kinase
MQGKLFFFCGKMAAGKSTLAREIAQRENAVLIEQDAWLEQLFPGEIVDLAGFIQYAARLRAVLTPHVVALLGKGISVVLDFPGNTRNQRDWFRELFVLAESEHELHYIDAPDELCKRQLKQRSQGLAEGSLFTSDAEFDAITHYFQPPSEAENFHIVYHQRLV